MLEARFACQNTLDDSDYITKWDGKSLNVSKRLQIWPVGVKSGVDTGEKSCWHAEIGKSKLLP